MLAILLFSTTVLYYTRSDVVKTISEDHRVISETLDAIKMVQNLDIGGLEIFKVMTTELSNEASPEVVTLVLIWYQMTPRGELRLHLSSY